MIEEPGCDRFQASSVSEGPKKRSQQRENEERGRNKKYETKETRRGNPPLTFQCVFVPGSDPAPLLLIEHCAGAAEGEEMSEKSTEEEEEERLRER